MHHGETTTVSHSGVWRRDLVFSDALLDEVAGGGWREACSEGASGLGLDAQRAAIAVTVR